MTVWDLNIFYGVKQHKLKAVLEYESNQVMRIRIQGEHSSILLENNYPLLKHLNPDNKKGLKWLLREGKLNGDKTKDAQFLTDTMKRLEELIKANFPLVSKMEQIQHKKSY